MNSENISTETQAKIKDAEYKNLLRVKDIVTRSENPDPIVILCLVIVTIAIMYFIFIHKIKLSISGIWLSDDNIQHIIVHDKFQDTILIDYKYTGVIKRNLVIIYVDDIQKIGIWTHDKILWLDNTIWYCSQGY